VGTGLGPTHVLQKAGTLFYLSKKALKLNAIDELWRVKAATSAKSLGAVIRSDTVTDQVRRELRPQHGLQGAGRSGQTYRGRAARPRRSGPFGRRS
jgi:hypothetical protein